MWVTLVEAKHGRTWDLGKVPIPSNCDNQVTIHMASNLKLHERIKHIEADCHLIHEKVTTGIICTLCGLQLNSWMYSLLAMM